jgi:hypothetical protein
MLGSKSGARMAYALVLTTAPLVGAHAQAWSYPSFQPPRIAARDFSGAISSADRAGTTVVFQWREGVGKYTQLSLDAGFADPPGEGRNFALGGGQYAYQITASGPNTPLDALFTAGFYAAFGRSQSFFRVPVGVSVGHRFGLDNGVGLTPYAHPRVVLERCTDCEELDHSHTDLGIQLDVGLELGLTKAVALRASALFGTTDRIFREGSGFGVALTFTPAPLSRFRR